MRGNLNINCIQPLILLLEKRAQRRGNGLPGVSQIVSEELGLSLWKVFSSAFIDTFFSSMTQDPKLSSTGKIIQRAHLAKTIHVIDIKNCMCFLNSRKKFSWHILGECTHITTVRNPTPWQESPISRGWHSGAWHLCPVLDCSFYSRMALYSHILWPTIHAWQQDHVYLLWWWAHYSSYNPDVVLHEEWQFYLRWKKKTENIC